MKLKICGIKRKEDVEYINRYSPDYIGFVFAGQKRKISFETAEELRKLVKPSITVVGVFVNEPVEHVIDLLQRNIIDMAQLHGTESDEEIVQIHEATGKTVIKALKVTKEEDILQYTNSHADYLLYDNGQGTGKCFSWEILLRLEEQGKLPKQPYFVAGGIDSTNAKQAMQNYVNAYGLDLSSGVETDGYKDEDKIKTVVEIIKGNR